jgi:hypothetical protein
MEAAALMLYRINTSNEAFNARFLVGARNMMQQAKPFRLLALAELTAANYH